MPSQLKTLAFALILAGQGAFAQDAGPGGDPAGEQFFIQVEARTSLAGAQSSVRQFGQGLNNVNGFSLGGGWYGVALGPYASRAEAEAFLGEFLGSGAVPPDSYVESSRVYGRQFWPVGAAVDQTATQAPQVQDVTTADPASDVAALREQLSEDGLSPQAEADTQADAPSGTAAQPGAPETPAAPEAAQAPEAIPETTPETTSEPAADTGPAVIDDETPREARASEGLLTREERDMLQVALRWAGFYEGRIDGAFGPGTRRSMAAWQEASNLEPTGILTTMQRAELLRQYNAVLDGMGMAERVDGRAGIAMQMPMGVVAFDRYEAPFAIYQPTTDLDVQVLLISQPGDARTLNGLYEIMQTLEIVPVEGERRRDSRGFLLTGANDRIVSHTEVGLQDGEIKGFTLIWPAGDEERRSRVLALMQDSYQRMPGVLDPAAVSDAGQAVDLVSGLKVRTPKGNGSGFFVDARGTVLAASATTDQCERVTINGTYDARVVASDAGLGVSLLQPVDPLAPRRVAPFTTDTQRLQSEVAVAGYSFGGVLTAPTLTFGTLEDTQGLNGEQGVKRLAVDAKPGDVGGPVFDAGGNVMGMLLPRDAASGRQLPDQVSFAAKGELILNFLRANGVHASATMDGAPLAPEDLTALAVDTTVLVSCW
ncbi:trypsin-like peptidase domain-containing protein [Sagittula salina]|uniref:Trypsin-like peptidase domain-containing protein n=1 Tax=Sagittula salina TaxID=2820268 RepID=A0A940MGH8_9RHOB|nr:trypsin-like peptidase domain-containing protein [Sagittula salina]MBP0481091.1 trypsin-like peptidase domain-containing protein [Sagittula salina]